MNPPAPDRQTIRLIARARAGDTAAYEQLFTRVTDRLLYFIELRLGGALRARIEPVDVLQETFIEAYKALESFEYRSDDAFARWLFRISENCVRAQADYFQAKKRRPANRRVERISQVAELARESSSGPATRAAASDERERLSKALDDLDDDERQAVLLRFYQDRTVDEIASLMDVSASTVKRLLGRATVRLGGVLRKRVGSARNSVAR